MMLSSIVTVVLSLAVLPSATTLSNIRQGDGFLRLPVAAINPTEEPHESKRQDVVPLANILRGTSYMVNCEVLSSADLSRSDSLVTIGAPAQPVSIALDTGSSDTWVNPTCSTVRSQIQRRLC